MTKKQAPNIARLVPLLVGGIMFNTLGTVMTSLGDVRFAFMAVGFAMIMMFAMKARASLRSSKKPEDR
ncbi:MAG: hypothetical protein M3Q42_02610 [Pseudomonadota bacterium]|nr:hypothetical protein [Pseudomonadota bacterium]